MKILYSILIILIVLGIMDLLYFLYKLIKTKLFHYNGEIKLPMYYLISFPLGAIIYLIISYNLNLNFWILFKNSLLSAIITLLMVVNIIIIIKQFTRTKKSFQLFKIFNKDVKENIQEYKSSYAKYKNKKKGQ